MRANRTRAAVAISDAQAPSSAKAARDRYDFTTIPYRGPEKLSPRVCLLLIAGTSMVLWIAVIEALRAVW